MSLLTSHPTRLTGLTRALLLALLLATAAPEALARQGSSEPVLVPPSSVAAESPSPGRAFLYSLALPGWGHRYANGGSWGASGTFFALADAALWSGLFGTSLRRNQIVESYRTLAVSSAGADMEGKNRTFILRLATFRSSDEFVEVSLRNRAWDDIHYADDPSFQWAWEREEDFLRFRTLREDGESLGRRRTALIATLVANRLLSGFLAARRARRPGETEMALSLRPPPTGTTPIVDFSLRF